MIEHKNGIFHIATANSSLLLRVTAYGHLALLHYGARVRPEDAEALAVKRVSVYGSSILYDEADPLYCLDTLPLAWSGAGRGDFRESPLEICAAGGRGSDFLYAGHEILPGSHPPQALPGAQGGSETLVIRLEDEAAGAALRLCFTAYEAADVIVRRAALENTGEKSLTIKKFMSQCLDLPGDYVMTHFSGTWIAESHRGDSPVGPARVVLESRTGFSSHRQNPGFLLSEPGTGEDHGRVYGFNLIYSGNHYASACRSAQGLTRLMNGLSGLDWELLPGECFETPEAVTSFSPDGFNGLSAQMHDFVNRHIVRGPWKGRERPVLFNNWEGCMFDFSQNRLLELAKRAKKLGCELFVLDDGWFGERNSDKAGLGDYKVNRKKLPEGLSGLAAKIKKLGMDFGLWFEPEAVNPDSELYRAHPDWALTQAGRKDLLGRHELLLDLTKPEVRDYIVQSMGEVLDGAEISYVKWDMNRHSLADGNTAHRYILGLYEILGRIFGPRPQILLESCSSGGNRFDLGMLCYSPQIWASDDTDPVERLDIQKGLSYLYPLSCMGAHVSAAPHQQTLRHTPLSTRGNVSFFGCLGYELDLKYLTPVEEQEIQNQIAFYKENRKLFQFGRFRRLKGPAGGESWQVSLEDRHGVGFFLRLSHAAPGFEELRPQGLERAARYRVAAREQLLRVGDFGELVKHIAPVRLDPKGPILGAADRHIRMMDCAESYTASGAALMAGLRLHNRFNGTGYNENIRVLGDFGSNIYLIERDDHDKA